MNKIPFSRSWSIVAALGIMFTLSGCRSEDGELSRFTSGTTKDGAFSWIGYAVNFPENSISVLAPPDKGCEGVNFYQKETNIRFLGSVCRK